MARDHRVRFVGWVGREKPSKSEPNAEGDRVFQSSDSRRHTRMKATTGPSGHHYRFRGALDDTSQWLPVRSAEDRSAFEDAEGYEVEPV